MDDSRKSHVVLLCDSSTLDDFGDLAVSEGWTFVRQHEGDGKVHGFSQSWRTADGTTEVHYVDEYALGLRFLVVRGQGAGDVGDAIGSNLAARTSINVVRVAREARTDEEKRTSAFELAAIFADPDPRAIDILRGYYEGGSEPVRRQVIAALTYRAWPEGVDLLEHIARVDESEELRRHAADVAAMYRAQSRAGSS